MQTCTHPACYITNATMMRVTCRTGTLDARRAKEYPRRHITSRKGSTGRWQAMPKQAPTPSTSSLQGGSCSKGPSLASPPWMSCRPAWLECSIVSRLQRQRCTSSRAVRNNDLLCAEPNPCNQLCTLYVSSVCTWCSPAAGGQRESTFCSSTGIPLKGDHRMMMAHAHAA